MKRLSLLNKLIFALNLLVVFFLLIACAIPYLRADFFSFLSFLSLSVPFLAIINFLFFLYWLLLGKRQLVPSLIVLLLGYFIFDTFVKIDLGGNEQDEGDLKVMTYNVRGFNVWHHQDIPNTMEKIKALIRKEDPDVLCFQEVGYDMDPHFMDYPYHYLKKIHTGHKVHLGLFSKYPIINAETIHFPNSINNGSYADIVVREDTIRVYNVHMQSLGVTPGSGNVRSKPVDFLYNKLNRRFKNQLQQAKMVEANMAGSPYPKILCGDFNNTQFSSTYHILKGDMADTFIEKGKGLGRTYDLFGVPFRIDFIFADQSLEIKSHKNFDEKLSDHFPVTASFSLKH
ncbi:endonuclease/exonuclease/phosphatase family protein [Pseudozobellia thermophila]|uniref:Metal-dependent hydrolase, endonuclease/exonuclease/phosphatase family n=1 Tax=Pseudozobellia thermophila TaxID=192903 RepID=A0A1M6J2A1_9FLAO|nr:endonuclease/exonuclease/phosphatase family protein [Pseudozobellia thermophila]SHJ40854.1 Metal-dependent hydrolase, endonuclease/exonuclease/phosphatase family [Pseudozobellia thermophila]